MKKLKSVITEFSQESQVANSWEGSFTGGYLSSIGFAEVEISSESPLDRGKYLGKEVTIIVGDDEPEITEDQAFNYITETLPLSKAEVSHHLANLVAHGGKVTYGEWEPLSEEWIDDNKEMYLINDTSENAVPDYKLRNLLVPKQEEIVVPEWFANWYEDRGYEMSLYGIFNDLYTNSKSKMEGWSKQYETGHAGLQNDIASIKLHDKGIYEVEKEQKYYVLLPEIVDNWKYVSLAPNHWGVTVRYTDTLDDVHEFTEQEIKDYDPRYWTFAKPVEEMEE